MEKNTFSKKSIEKYINFRKDVKEKAFEIARIIHRSFIEYGMIGIPGYKYLEHAYIKQELLEGDEPTGEYDDFGNEIFPETKFGLSLYIYGEEIHEFSTKYELILPVEVLYDDSVIYDYINKKMDKYDQYLAEQQKKKEQQQIKKEIENKKLYEELHKKYGKQDN